MVGGVEPRQKFAGRGVFATASVDTVVHFFLPWVYSTLVLYTQFVHLSIIICKERPLELGSNGRCFDCPLLYFVQREGSKELFRAQKEHFQSFKEAMLYGIHIPLMVNHVRATLEVPVGIGHILA